jgi:N-acetylglucosaminyldiphosphoundecaprenol N-acetyl-beta-D-mannosaminyltransferase
MGRMIAVAGVPIISETRQGLARRMVDDWQRNRDSGYSQPAKLILCANGQSLSMYWADPAYRKLVDAADMIHADGMSMVYATRLKVDSPLPERIATTDWFHDAAEAAQEAGLSFYLLGGTEETNRIAYEKMQARYPGLKMAGRRNGYYSPEEEQQVIRDILAAKPDILWVGLGRPKQEEFCIRNREALTGVTWLKTCGGLFNFLADDVVRAPDWVQTAGFEWLWRTMQEPRRLFWRYLTTNLHAIWVMWRHTRELPALETEPRSEADLAPQRAGARADL